MRLHPAVATALVLVGGVLVALPVYEWLRLTAVCPTGSDVPSSLILGSLMSGALGLVLILLGVLSSVETRPGSGTPA
jgi:hypothetical protein